MDKKICPMRFVSIMDHECLGEKCEWWLVIPSFHGCSVPGLVEVLIRRLPGA